MPETQYFRAWNKVCFCLKRCVFVFETNPTQCRLVSPTARCISICDEKQGSYLLSSSEFDDVEIIRNKDIAVVYGFGFFCSC